MNALAHHRHAALRRIAGWLAAAYLMALALIALWPTPVDRAAAGTITRILVFLHAHGVPQRLDYPLIEFTANIALFVPVGLLGVLLMGRRRWLLAFLVGFIASCAIEFGQLVLLPARVATPVDVIANTAGTALGALLALALLAIITARSPAPQAQQP
ncbi:MULTISPECIES: VanZ family protein [Cryobacterium]|uniref:VanZ family protein n=1 Tax=Cryobacterium zongtaii TaxID=1259217 RepID=A0A2S3Z6R3_9MICO|nr:MULTISPECIES: VanZ family protein [Cryobacterium]POH60843.1 VanZ family protein [Cryobacterium zongtaii]POH69216.1 VanZ family protein [Cryobacterium zongtaii]TFC41079.1 VanZ family protein [Cryobacterium sp. TMN-39-2]